jgi:hypothetical protein
VDAQDLIQSLLFSVFGSIKLLAAISKMNMAPFQRKYLVEDIATEVGSGAGHVRHLTGHVIDTEALIYFKWIYLWPGYTHYYCIRIAKGEVRKCVRMKQFGGWG